MQDNALLYVCMQDNALLCLSLVQLCCAGHPTIVLLQDKQQLDNRLGTKQQCDKLQGLIFATLCLIQQQQRHVVWKVVASAQLCKFILGYFVYSIQKYHDYICTYRLQQCSRFTIYFFITLMLSVLRFIVYLVLVQNHVRSFFVSLLTFSNVTCF